MMNSMKYMTLVEAMQAQLPAKTCQDLFGAMSSTSYVSSSIIHIIVNLFERQQTIL